MANGIVISVIIITMVKGAPDVGNISFVAIPYDCVGAVFGHVYILATRHSADPMEIRDCLRPNDFGYGWGICVAISPWNIGEGG